MFASVRFAFGPLMKKWAIEGNLCGRDFSSSSPCVRRLLTFNVHAPLERICPGEVEETDWLIDYFRNSLRNRATTDNRQRVSKTVSRNRCPFARDSASCYKTTEMIN